MVHASKEGLAAVNERLPTFAAFESALRGAESDTRRLAALATAIPFDHETAVTLADRIAGVCLSLFRAIQFLIT